MKMMGTRSVASFLGGLVNLAWYVDLVLLALSVCLLIVSPLIDPPHVEANFEFPASFRMEAAFQPVAVAPQELEHVHLEKTNGSLFFSPRSRVFVAAAAVVLMIVLALVAWVLAQLRALFATLRAGRPFVAANALRLRRIAYAVIAAEFARSLFTYFGSRYVMTHFTLQGGQFVARFDISGRVLIGGLIVLVIAEVFNEGTRLNDEQSLTI
ncbi:MAG TPA: DUF2975 domain-containing protein [Vicinamibacterales bacterium]|jgi:hypothetical protein|nr:DUF2975 domain-containing protein [Vicinamibacterales bacterium]